MKNKVSFERFLKSARNGKKLTQKEMAAFLEIPYSTYCQYEQGFKVGGKHVLKIMQKLVINPIHLEE